MVLITAFLPPQKGGGSLTSCEGYGTGQAGTDVLMYSVTCLSVGVSFGQMVRSRHSVPNKVTASRHNTSAPPGSFSLCFSSDWGHNAPQHIFFWGEKIRTYASYVIRFARLLLQCVKDVMMQSALPFWAAILIVHPIKTEVKRPIILIARNWLRFQVWNRTNPSWNAPVFPFRLAIEQPVNALLAVMKAGIDCRELPLKKNKKTKAQKKTEKRKRLRG